MCSEEDFHEVEPEIALEVLASEDKVDGKVPVVVVPVEDDIEPGGQSVGLKVVTGDLDWLVLDSRYFDLDLVGGVRVFLHANDLHEHIKDFYMNIVDVRQVIDGRMIGIADGFSEQSKVLDRARIFDVASLRVLPAVVQLQTNCWTIDVLIGWHKWAAT